MIISIGVGNLVSPDELNGMASLDKSGNPLVYQVGSYAMLTTVQDQLSQVACEADVGRYGTLLFGAQLILLHESCIAT